MITIEMNRTFALGLYSPKGSISSMTFTPSRELSVLPAIDYAHVMSRDLGLFLVHLLGSFS